MRVVRAQPPGARPPRGRSGWVDSGGVRLHHLEYGTGGPVVVIVPGITSPAITWEFVAEELASEARVVTLDVRGRGLSDAPAGGYALPDYAGDVARVIESLELDRPPVLLGHSMGARIAAAAGVLHADLVGPLIIADPPLTGPGRTPYPTPLESFYEQLREGYAGTTAAEVRRFYPRWPDAELELRAQWLCTCAEHAVVQTYEHFDREDFLGLWERLPGPVLFVHGEESPVVGPQGLADAVAANPAAEVAGIPGAGHMIPWENREDFLAAVRTFVRTHAPIQEKTTWK